MQDEVIVLNGVENYSDARGNRVIGTVPENVRIKFVGSNAALRVGENFQPGREGCTIRLAEDADISIGNNVRFGSWCNLNTYPRGNISVEDNCRFAADSFIGSWSDSVIRFGAGTTMEAGNAILALPYTEISFGRDVMISRQTFYQSNDGHAIFDIKTGENINSTPEISKTRKIKIGDHVWIGQSAIVLYNTEVGNGSVIGAGSLVKGRFPNNCTIAGVPARIVKRDIAWSRNETDSFLDLPEEWRRETE